MTTKVAVYGSLRKGFGNNILLGSSVCLGDDKVRGFDLYSFPHRGFPMVTPGKSEVVVEVYEVNEEVFARLDMLEGYPSFYNREMVKTKDNHDAWIYFIADKRDDLVKVDSGDWKEFKSVGE